MANTTIKQLASFAVLSVNGGSRVSYTYDEIDAETGDVIPANNKGSFFAIDPTLQSEIENIRDYIRENKLQ